MWRIISKSPTRTLKCVLASSRHSLSTMPPLHHSTMSGTIGTPLLRSPLWLFCPCHRRRHSLLSQSRRHLRPPWARHPLHSVMLVSFLFPTTHPTIASIIRTLVQTLGGRGGGGRKDTITPITRSLQLLLGGQLPRSKKIPLSPRAGSARHG